MNSLHLIIVILAVIVCFLALLLHVIAVTLLCKLKSAALKGSQKYLMICLCFAEIGLCVTFISNRIIFILHFQKHVISAIVSIFQATVLGMMYAIVMIIITVDRFLEFRLAIKYTMFCTVKLTKIVVLFFIFLTSVVFSLVLVLFARSPWNYQKFLWLYVYVPGNIVFVVTASLTYFFIFKKLRQNRRDFERRRREVNAGVQKKSTFKLFIPSFIIVTFVLFTVMPNLILVFSSKENMPKLFQHIWMILYPIGWISDPLIYIFSLKAVRKKIRRIATQNRSRRSNVKSRRRSNAISSTPED